MKINRFPTIVSTVLFLLLSITIQHGHAASTTINPGDSIVTGKVMSSEWVTGPTISDGYLSGSVRTRYRFVRSTAAEWWNAQLVAGESPIYITTCIEVNDGHRTARACPTGHDSSVKCLPVDRGLIVNCMNRIEGMEDSYTQTYNLYLNYIVPTEICLENKVLYNAGGSAGINSFAPGFDPFPACGPSQGAPPAPNPVSVCTLNNQELHLAFTTNNLDAGGLQQASNLEISCTTGTPANYTLRLTGTTVVNGALSFGNGVTARVQLNNVAVEANGSGVSFPSLTTRTIPISATLQGTGTAPGERTAAGVIILEAQ